MVAHSPPTAEATTAGTPAVTGGRLAAPAPQPAARRAMGRAVAQLLGSPAAGDDASGTSALAAAATTRRLARCAGGSCGCRDCGHGDLRPEQELEAIRAFFTPPPAARRVLARRPAYRPSPPWASRDPSQAE